MVAGLLALSIGSGGDLFAADPPEPVAPKERPAVEWTLPRIEDLKVERIDTAHEEQARFFGEFFEKVDRVFGEEYVQDRERKVEARAGVETTLNDEGTGTGTGLNLGLRVPLPAMKRRFNVFLDIGEDVNELGAASNPNFQDSEKKFSLALGVLRRYRDNLEAGIKLRLLRSSGAVFSIDPFVRFEERLDPMRYFFEQRVIWVSDNSWSTWSGLDVDRRIGSELFLRLRTRVDYSFEDSGAKVAHGLIVRRGVFEASGLSPELWLEYNTAKDDPTTFADDTIAYAQLRFRGRIWRNWLEYELRPAYTIPIDSDRSPFFSFLVGLTVIWGSYLGGGIDDPGEVDR